MRKTVDRKLKIEDTIYIFRVPIETSLDCEDIIKIGRILMVKVGMKPAEDVYGNLLGRKGSAWNSQKPILMDCEGAINYWKNNISCAIERAKRLIEAEELNPGPKLNQPSVTRFQGKLIERSDEPEPHYFIAATSICDNCQCPIEGTQTIEINHNGKVSKAHPFVANDPKVLIAKNGSKKLLHPQCAVNHIKFEPELTLQDVIETASKEGMKVNFTLKEKEKTPFQILETILKDQAEYTAEFARGAAYMFHIMNKPNV